jgi:hypothetical protein
MRFQGFSPGSFEQLVRALAIKIIGPGVTAFGNGPDGGREATFRGRLHYPYPPTSVWDGYGVIQAKFKERDEGAAKDSRWVQKQIDLELQTWCKSEKRKPKPEYFIFCTNVDLSSAASGGRDAADSTILGYAERLGLKGHAVWDWNQLRAYIDGEEEIRRRFLCFLTGGDLLAEFSRHIKGVPDPDAVLTTYLSRELLADEDARLSQAGDRSEDRIRLADVFIDLPASEKANLDPEIRGEAEEGGSLHALLHTASQKLDPLSLYEANQGLSDEAENSEKLFGRFVFIGGPGSGKSTVGQFIAQIHRAALLDRRPAYRLEDRVKHIISEMKARCEEEKAAWPSTPRYPFRVELNAFAKALSNANGAVKTFSEYLRLTLSRDVTLSHEDLRDWLRLFPWLLILDGLDEVPSSSNRREVIAAIQTFLSEARDVEADLMIVASSRPDGYAGEFHGDQVLQLYLSPLSKSRALACAKRYLKAKALPDARLADALTILDGATNNPLIARLMRSPLQVTFMVTVVAASGKPSESRWQLFNDYYRTIYERELHKAVPPFDQVLNVRRQDIDALHHRVGFILQRRAELSGGTQADLSFAEFEQLVEQCLEENGLGAADLTRQKQMILGAARSRLVFITSRTPHRLTFDVRSLQEYMAAAFLTNADSAEVMSRLDAIVHASYWRNTLLFAVGRFFVEPQMRQHRDKIRVLCEDLNRKEPQRAKALLGSRIALEILESGTVGNVPLITRSLAHCALALLSIPHPPQERALERLASVYEPSMEMEFRAEILLRIGHKHLTSALSAWVMAMYLERREVGWAKDVVSREWPQDRTAETAILRAWFEYNRSEPGTDLHRELDKRELDRLEQIVRAIPLNEALELIECAMVEPADLQDHWLGGLVDDSNSNDDRLQVRVGTVASGLSIRVCLLSKDEQRRLGALECLSKEHHIDAERARICKLLHFIQQPSSATLAPIVEDFAAGRMPAGWTRLIRSIAPWPLASLSDATSSALAGLRDGGFQDAEAWHEKERRWIAEGLTLEELCEPLFPGGRSLCAAVYAISATRVDINVATAMANAILEKLGSVEDLIAKDRLSWTFAFYASVTQTLHHLDPALIRDRLLPSRKQWWSNDLIDESPQTGAMTEDWLSFYNAYGLLENLSFHSSTWRLENAAVEPLLSAFREAPARRGLLRLAGFWCAAGRETVTGELPGLHTLSDPKDVLALLVVRMGDTTLTPKDAQALTRFVRVIAAATEIKDRWSILLNTIDKHGRTIPALEILLDEIADLVPQDDQQLLGRAQSLRNSLLQSRPSILSSSTLENLGLAVL